MAPSSTPYPRSAKTIGGASSSNDFLAPFLETRQEEARARRDGAQACPHGWRSSNTSLNECSVHVILGSWIARLKLFLGCNATDAEGWIHQHNVVPLTKQLEQGNALTSIVGEEAPSRALASSTTACIRMQGVDESLLGFGRRTCRHRFLRGLAHSARPECRSQAVSGDALAVLRTPPAHARSQSTSSASGRSSVPSRPRATCLPQSGGRGSGATAGSRSIANSETISASPGIGSAMTMPVRLIAGRSAASTPASCHARCARSQSARAGDLGCSRINIDTVQVVLDNQLRQSAIDVFLGRERITERPVSADSSR